MSASYSPARRHCLLTLLADRHGIEVRPAFRAVQAVPVVLLGLLLAVLLLAAAVVVHLVLAVVVPRQARRRLQGALPEVPTAPAVPASASVEVPVRGDDDHTRLAGGNMEIVSTLPGPWCGVDLHTRPGGSNMVIMTTLPAETTNTDDLCARPAGVDSAEASAAVARSPGIPGDTLAEAPVAVVVGSIGIPMDMVRADLLQPDTDEPTGPCFEDEDDRPAAEVNAQINCALPARRPQSEAEGAQINCVPVARDDRRTIRPPRKRRRRALEAAQRLPATDAIEADLWASSEWDEVVTLAGEARFTTTGNSPDDAFDRLQADATAAIVEGQAWLARRAEAKQAESQDLAGRSVVELRRLAARCGIKNTRTARKVDLLTALANVGA